MVHIDLAFARIDLTFHFRQRSDAVYPVGRDRYSIPFA